MLKTVEEANTKKGNFLGLSSTFDNSPRFVMAEEASKVKDDNGQLLKIADQVIINYHCDPLYFRNAIILEFFVVDFQL